ncbi:MAG TPA: DedA family protein [Pseudonocardia sp.]|nr:DedA family protein [Pseudonocardia sp.]
MSADPSHVVAALMPVLARYGYLAVVALVLVESFGIPAPGQTILIVAGLSAGAGRLNVVLVATLGFLAAVTGDSIGYWIGRAGGRRLVLRVGRYVFLTEERLDAVERFFTRHGGKIVVVARFVDGLRQFNGVVAGLANMRWWRFLACNALGAAVWAALWTSVGYFAGRHLDRVYRAVERYETYFLVLLVAVVAVLLGRWIWRRRRARAASS